MSFFDEQSQNRMPFMWIILFTSTVIDELILRKILSLDECRWWWWRWLGIRFHTLFLHFSIQNQRRSRNHRLLHATQRNNICVRIYEFDCWIYILFVSGMNNEIHEGMNFWSLLHKIMDWFNLFFVCSAHTICQLI